MLVSARCPYLERASNNKSMPVRVRRLSDYIYSDRGAVAFTSQQHSR